MCHPTSNQNTRGKRSGFAAVGFTLAELMVSMAITAMIMAAALYFFDEMLNTCQAAVAIADINQNLRAAANMIARDLTMAGAEIPIGGVPLPGGSGSGPVTRPGPGALTFPAATGVVSVITPGFTLGPTLDAQQSDIITILTVDPLSQLDEYNLTLILLDGTRITVDSRTDISTGVSRVLVGDLLMLTNMKGSALGIVTAVNTSTNEITFGSPDPLNLNQATAANGWIPSLQDAGPPVTYPPAVAKKVQMVTYFVDNSISSRPQLMRQFGASAAIPVALIITSLQFTYDLSNGTTVNQRDVTTPNEIRKVNLMVTGRSEFPSRKTKQYLCNTIFTSATVRNLAYRNKY
jgi:prepilin-type N-terminal cleavage/methylation domain-containing protein